MIVLQVQRQNRGKRKQVKKLEKHRQLLWERKYISKELMNGEPVVNMIVLMKD